MKKITPFTLIELLVTIAILIVLASLIQPSLSKMIAHSQTTLCQQNLRTISASISLYTQDHDDQLPGPSFSSQTPRFMNKWGSLDRNLAVYLSTYLEVSTDKYQDKYLKDFVCPTNEELELSKNLARRTIYRVNDKKRPFGYPVASHSPTLIIPKYLNELSEPNETWAMTDADRKNCSWISENQAPDLPLHSNYSRNYLYFDHHVSNLTPYP